jgi:DNA topoisomerase I
VTKTGALCPQCGGDLVERKTKQKRRIFYGCNNYPTCNFAIWERPVPDLCSNCGGLMVVARVGQDPVCYNEVVAVQRSLEEKPRQDGTTTRRVTRKKVTTGKAAVSTTTKTARRGSTATRKKPAQATAGSNTTKRPSRVKKVTTRAATARKKSTSTGRRTTAKRATKQTSSVPESI